MKWKTPKEGDIRVVTEFLFLPLNLNQETRWLIRTSWKQIYKKWNGWNDHEWIE